MKKNTKVSTIKSLENSKLTKEQMHKATGGAFSNYFDDDWCGTKPFPPLPWPPRFNYDFNVVVRY